MEGEFHLDTRYAHHADPTLRQFVDSQYEFTIFVRMSYNDPAAVHRVFVTADGGGQNPQKFRHAVAHVAFEIVAVVGARYHKSFLPEDPGRLSARNRRPDRDSIAGSQNMDRALVFVEINPVQ